MKEIKRFHTGCSLRKQHYQLMSMFFISYRPMYMFFFFALEGMESVKQQRAVREIKVFDIF